jgi:hypothetical protein
VLLDYDLENGLNGFETAANYLTSLDPSTALFFEFLTAASGTLTLGLAIPVDYLMSKTVLRVGKYQQ